MILSVPKEIKAEENRVALTPIGVGALVAHGHTVLVETDAPFLTPMPYRGRPNASYLVPLTMRLMAQVRGEDLGELCAAVDANTEVAFGGAW